MVDVTETKMDDPVGAVRIAVEGCGHGTLDAIYESIQRGCEMKGWDGVDLVIIGGDFQAVRDQRDLNVTAMPAKYRQMADFHQYYWGTKTAPYLTIFVGGNHEASNHLFELYYGGWAAPNIYYLGAANVIQVGPLKIAAMSGIWKGYDYRKPHYERLPYSQDDMYSIYHVRELDVRKLLSFRSQVDIGVSHDWPKGIEWLGDHNQLFKHKPHLREDAQSGKLGNTAAQQVMDRLRPLYWFSAHLHTKYAAAKSYKAKPPTGEQPKIAQLGVNDGQTQNMALRLSPQQEQLSAWNSFGSRVRKEEAEETLKILQEEKTRREEAERTGVPVAPNYILNETYKQVRLGNGLQRDLTSVTHSKGPEQSEEDHRTIPQFDGCCASLPLKRRRENSSSPGHEAHRDTRYTSITDDQLTNSDTRAASSNVAAANPDAIDIDMSDDETTQLTVNAETPATEPSSTNPVAPSMKEQTPTDGTTPHQEAFPDKNSTDVVSNEVSQDIREQLAALSSKFEPPTQTSASLPHPEDIKNKTTRFLALSKCEDRQNFLQLLEISSNHLSQRVADRPLKLQYVPEWLAILRVFAPELELGGNPHDQVSQHRGDTYYRDRILKEEDWVQENIVKKEKLVVPENFIITVSSDAAGDMPREVTNPQTTTFCNMIGIDNLFDISEEERDSRMAAGPTESSRTEPRGRNDHGNRSGQRGRAGVSRGGRGRIHRGWSGRGGGGRGR